MFEILAAILMVLSMQGQPPLTLVVHNSDACEKGLSTTLFYNPLLVPPMQSPGYMGGWYGVITPDPNVCRCTMRSREYFFFKVPGQNPLPNLQPAVLNVLYVKGTMWINQPGGVMVTTLGPTTNVPPTLAAGGGTAWSIEIK